MTLERTPLAPIAVAFGVGIVLAPLIEPGVLWTVWLAALAIGAGLLTLGRARGAAVTLLVAVAALGALRGTEEPLPPDHLARLGLPRVASVEGRLAVEPTRWAPDRTRLLIDAERADGASVSGRIQATVYGVPPSLTEGQRIATRLKLHPATGFRNPGTFDYGAHLARQGIRVVATGRAESIATLDDLAPPWTVRVRRAAVAAIGEALPPGSAALLAGLLLGDRTDLPRDVDEAFRLAGVYHVLAVSGFNVAILAAAAWALCRFLRLPRRAGAATAIVIVIGFALVVGPSPSVLRAVLMAVLVLAALLLERDASVTNSLALAALAILAVRPGDLFDPGFQLSFAATLGIVVAPLPRGLIVGALAVSTAAQLAVLPVTLAHFNQLSTIGVIANLGVVPLAGAATVMGLVAVGLSFLSETVGAVAFDAVWPVLLALRGIVALAARVPGAVVHLPAPGPIAVTCYVGGLALLLLPARAASTRSRLAHQGVAVRASRLRGRHRGVAARAIARRAASDRRARRRSGRRGGRRDAQRPHVAGRRRIRWTDAPGRRRARRRAVSLEPRRPPSRRRRRHARRRRSRRRRGGGTTPLPDRRAVDRPERPVGAAAVRPRARDAVAAAGAARGRRNDAGLVLRVELGLASFLLAADIGAAREHELVVSGARLASTVLKIAHHGSRFSTTAEFLRAVRPTAAAISVGARNAYGHPDSGVLARLAEEGVEVYRTDRDGAVIFETDGGTLTVTRWARRTVDRFCLEPEGIC